MMRSKYDRKVLLAVRAGRIDPRLLVSTRSLCQRMEAGLDILMPAGDGRPGQVCMNPTDYRS